MFLITFRRIFHSLPSAAAKVLISAAYAPAQMIIEVGDANAGRIRLLAPAKWMIQNVEPTISPKFAPVKGLAIVANANAMREKIQMRFVYLTEI